MVIQRRRNGFLRVDDMVVADPVEFAGGYPWLHVGFDHLQDLGG